MIASNTTESILNMAFEKINESSLERTWVGPIKLVSTLVIIIIIIIIIITLEISKLSSFNVASGVISIILFQCYQNRIGPVDSTSELVVKRLFKCWSLNSLINLILYKLIRVDRQNHPSTLKIKGTASQFTTLTLKNLKKKKSWFWVSHEPKT